MSIRDLISPFGWLYGAIGDLRQTLYRKNLFKSYSLNIPTISVGNITTGGTGKTPLVAFIAELFAQNGKKVCILTRGYGRENPKERVLVSDGENIFADSLQAGDEPFELAHKLSEKAIIIADANRVEAGFWAGEKYDFAAFILDDGFQHTRVKRDLDIVLIDATDPFGKNKSFLRESFKGLKRAQLIVISRANLVERCEISNLKSQISKINPQCKIFVTENKVKKLIKLKDFLVKSKNNEAEKENQFLANSEVEKEDFNFQQFSSETRCAAFCALGNPENFFGQLRNEKFNLVYTKNYADHHFYSQSEILKLEKESVAEGAEILLTTWKDAVKLTHLNFNLSCYVVESGLIFDNESAFVEIVQSLTADKEN